MMISVDCKVTGETHTIIFAPDGDHDHCRSLLPQTHKHWKYMLFYSMYGYDLFNNQEVTAYT